MTIPNALPSPPSTDGDVKPATSQAKRTTKIQKQGHRNLKRASSTRSSQDPAGLMVDGRHKRVWKACERCRMKKTKCDGESPCKRCKDDGLVCTAGSRKKAEFKQLPRGYAEVLESTQYALIGCVQKLYTMVRNNEPWTLGEPQLNDRGLPVIHNIAEKLGCIRPSPDLMYAFPEDASEFADLQQRLKAEEDEENNPSKAHASPARRDRASSSESDHSALSHDYKPSTYAAQVPPAPLLSLNHVPDFCTQSLVSESQFGDDSFYEGEFRTSDVSFDDAPPPPLDFDIKNSHLSSPIYAEFPPQLEFAPDAWAPTPDELLANGRVDLASLQLRQAQAQQMHAAMAAAGGMYNMGACGGGAGSDGTIRPNLLDCRNRGGAAAPPFDLADHMGGFMFTEFAGRV